MAVSGQNILLYGVVMRDKSRTADASTLTAYKTVAEDLLKDASGVEADELKEALSHIDAALKHKS